MPKTFIFVNKYRDLFGEKEKLKTFTVSVYGSSSKARQGETIYSCVPTFMGIVKLQFFFYLFVCQTKGQRLWYLSDNRWFIIHNKRQK